MLDAAAPLSPIVLRLRFRYAIDWLLTLALTISRQYHVIAMILTYFQEAAISCRCVK